MIYSIFMSLVSASYKRKIAVCNVLHISAASHQCAAVLNKPAGLSLKRSPTRFADFIMDTPLIFWYKKPWAVKQLRANQKSAAPPDFGMSPHSEVQSKRQILLLCYGWARSCFTEKFCSAHSSKINSASSIKARTFSLKIQITYCFLS